LPGFVLRQGGVDEGGDLPSLIVSLNSVNGDKIDARLVLDSGAQASFIRRDLVDKLGVEEYGKSNITLIGICGKRTSVNITHCTVVVYSKISDYNLSMNFKVLENICADLTDMDVQPDDLANIEDLRLTEEHHRRASPVHILIGQDYLHDVIRGKIDKAERSILVWDTEFGSALSGKPSSCPDEIAINVEKITNEVLYAQLRKFWEIEELTLDKKFLLSPLEKYAEKHYVDNVKFVDGQYMVKLPFDPDKPKPINNYYRALAQFKSLERTLLRDKSKQVNYAENIEQYINNNFAEMVNDDVSHEKECYFLPHHAVYRPTHATTKTRIVFNASADDGSGYTLNNALLPGPALQPDLVDCLFRFRTWKFALTGDIKKMFNMILVDPDDRKWLRFFWRKTGTNDPIKVYQKRVLPFGLNTSPFLAIRTILFHVAKYATSHPETVALMRENLYVDDIIFGKTTVNDVVKLVQEIEFILNEGGFSVKKWLSNSAAVMRTIPAENCAAIAPLIIAEKDFNLSEDAIVSALGIVWNPLHDLDVFEMSGAVQLGIVKPNETMRSLCSRAAKIYDPCGFCSPFLIIAKMLMQETWKLGLKWDELLPEEIAEPWEAWVQDMLYLHYLDIPRCFLLDNYVKISLHGFSDASERAICACIYIVTEDDQGKTLSLLVASKTKLAPIKMTTIPRLELKGALLLAQLMHKVEKALVSLAIKEIFLWTDSTVTLAWLRKPGSNWKTFVGNRVQQIQELYDESKWRHVPTQLNPADHGSRGIMAHNLIDLDQWFYGPEFLLEYEESWPMLPLCLNPDSPVVDAETKEYVRLMLTYTLQKDFLKEMFHIKREFWRSLRQLAFLLRFINNINYCLKKKSASVKYWTSYPSPNEMASATNLWAKFVQEQSLQTELNLLNEKTPKVSSGSKLAQLQAYVDDSNLMRVGGRLQDALLPDETKHQIILPSNNEYVRRYIMAVHIKWVCAGAEETLHHLRTKFWLLGGRREVKIAIRLHKCYRFKAKTFQQQMAPLPKMRLEPMQSFVNVGVDFFGHEWILNPRLTAKEVKEGTVVQPKIIKVWVVIFACLTSRAIHLELITDMSTQTYIYSLQRMIARRGLPKLMLSDNAEQFKKSAREMARLWRNLDWDAIAKFGISFQNPIEFRFITPLAPWQGAAYERLIGSVKMALKSTLWKRIADLNEFNTALCNAEAVVNSRPISAVSDDVNDFNPITPGHLLLGRPLQTLPDYLTRDDDECSVAILWRKRQRLHAEYWTRWQKAYLEGLQKAQKWHVKNAKPPKIGEVVLVIDIKLPKLQWPLGVIIDTHEGRDGKIRSVTLRTTFSKKHVITRRHLHSIMRLEDPSEVPIVHVAGCCWK
jgi:hypothetical protein